MKNARSPNPWLIAIAALLSTACSVGQGEGGVASDRLLAKDCWCSGYSLSPNFFAAVPYRDTVQMRVQRGTDLTETSDGLSVLVNDVKRIRGERGGDSLLGKPVAVTVPQHIEILGGERTWDPGLGCAPVPEPDPDGGPGSGIVQSEWPEPCDTSKLLPEQPGEVIYDDPDHPLVHLSLYLQQSCHNQNVVLQALRGRILFTSLYSADPNEPVGSERYSQAVFDVEVGDLNDTPLGMKPKDIPPEKRSNVKGCFQFYYERGQPGQPFP